MLSFELSITGLLLTLFIWSDFHGGNVLWDPEEITDDAVVIDFQMIGYGQASWDLNYFLGATTNCSGSCDQHCKFWTHNLIVQYSVKAWETYWSNISFYYFLLLPLLPLLLLLTVRLLKVYHDELMRATEGKAEYSYKELLIDVWHVLCCQVTFIGMPCIVYFITCIVYFTFLLQYNVFVLVKCGWWTVWRD